MTCIYFVVLQIRKQKKAGPLKKTKQKKNKTVFSRFKLLNAKSNT